MKRCILSTLFFFVTPVLLSAAPRSFTDQDGESIKAEMMGVKNGQVMLKERTTIKPFALSSFSLDDRDYIIKWLKDKRHTKLLNELMQAAVREIGGGNGNDQPGGPIAGGAVGPGPGAIPNVNGPAGAAGFNEAPKGPSGADASKTKTMYTLKLPTDPLLKEQRDRSWTDIMGDTLTGTFDHIEANGAVILKEASGSPRRVPFVLFSRDDIDYLIAAFKEDLDAEVFPKGGFVAPTPAQESSGYRVWTDRRGERLSGKFVSRSGNTVTIEVGGVNKTFPFNGLSQDDKNHIGSQEQKNQPQAGNAPIAAAGGGGFPNAGGMPPGSAPPGFRPPGFGPPGFGPQGIGARPFGPMPPSSIPNPAVPNPAMPNPAMPNPMPPGAGLAGGGGGNPWSVPNAGMRQYQFKCDTCGREWTGNSPISECENCRNTYEFHCSRCGHKWTRKNQMMDKCPNCTGGLANNGAGAMPPAAGGNSFTSNNSSTTGGGTTRVRIPGVLIGKVIAGICALLGIGYGANKARGEG